MGITLAIFLFKSYQMGKSVRHTTAHSSARASHLLLMDFRGARYSVGSIFHRPRVVIQVSAPKPRTEVASF